MLNMKKETKDFRRKGRAQTVVQIGFKWETFSEMEKIFNSDACWCKGSTAQAVGQLIQGLQQRGTGDHDP